MITNNGLVSINKFLVGANGDWAGSIGIGLLSTSATTASTTNMQYEIARYPINLKSYRPLSASSKIILKTSIPAELIASVYEIAVYPANSLNSYTPDYVNITDFSESGASSSWTVGSNPAPYGASTRVGGYSIVIGQNQTASYSGFSLDTSTFTSTDYLNLLYYTAASIGSGTVTVTLGDSSSSVNYWSASGTLSATASNNWGVLQLSFGTKPSSFSQVYSASISTTTSGSLALDHLKFVKNYTKPDELKVLARSESASPFVTKNYGQAVELEYYLQVN